MYGRRMRGGFALVELVAVGVVAGLLAAMVLVAGRESRRLARLGDDIAKLRQLGSATGSYAADNSDLFWTFSWKKGATLSQWADLNTQAQGSDLAAASAQAVDILRRLAGRLDINPISGWWVYSHFSQLVLTEYQRGVFPDLSATSAADERRLTWARNPAGYDAGLYPPGPTVGGPGTNSGKRWPYSSSFMLEAAFFDGAVAGQCIQQGPTHSTWSVPSTSYLSTCPISETASPAQKVHLHETNARHFSNRSPYSTHDEARSPQLFVDGHVAVHAAKDANRGWQPNAPSQPDPTVFNYQPDAWEPPTQSGSAIDIVFGRFRWTRGCPSSMLAGRDFGGPEVCPPPP